MEFVDAERARRVAQQLLHQPAQHLGLAEVVALQHVAQQHHVDIAAQQGRVAARIQPLRLGEAANGQVLQQVVLQLRMLGLGEAAGGLGGRRPAWRRASRRLKGVTTASSARPRMLVATSRESSLADEPDKNSSTFSLSSRRRAKPSQPGTTWISSRKKVARRWPRHCGCRR